MPPTNGRPTDLEAKVAELARQVDELRSGTISSANGNVVLPPGKSLTVVDEDGSTLAHIGALFRTLPDGTRETGVVLRRQDGAAALTVAYDGNVVDAYRQVLSLWDGAGNQVFGDDGASGQGLSRPYVPIGLARANLVEMPGVTAATFADTEIGLFYKQHPKLLVRVNAGCDVSGTTGEVRVLLDDVVVDTTASLGFAVGFQTFGPFVVPGDHMSQHSIRIQARRTAGTGTVRASGHALGVQS